jgi:O-antigen/teichoic acid export membrane protein
MMIQVIDRPILEALTDRATVGIYQANYRLGIFMMLVVSTFDFAWRPFSLAHGRDPDAPQLFARILTYFLLIGTTIFLLLALFLEDIVKWPVFWGRSILPEAYWGGLNIIPVVLLAYLCLGISNNIVAGVYIEKRTALLPPITFFGAAVNVAANFLLIPRWGIMGAAVATLMSYAGMAMVLGVLVRRIYPVRYETARLLKIVAAGTAVFAAGQVVGDLPGALIWKTLLMAGFVGLMVVFRFSDAGEMRAIAAMVGKRK